MKRNSTLIAIASGKGGAGKSVIAVNLAEVLSETGHTVALVDADFGQGACAILMNETPPHSTLDFARHTAQLHQVMHRTASGVTLVQGVAEPGQIEGREAECYASLDRVLDELRRTHNVILIDAPAGTDGPVRWALDRADMGMLVIAGEPTAIADTYRLCKLVWQAEPAYPFCTVVNFADTEEDACSVADRFGKITERFIGKIPEYLGWLPFSAQVRHSVMEQRPVVRQAGALRNHFGALAQAVMQDDRRVLEAVSRAD